MSDITTEEVQIVEHQDSSSNPTMTEGNASESPKEEKIEVPACEDDCKELSEKESEDDCKELSEKESDEDSEEEDEESENDVMPTYREDSELYVVVADEVPMFYVSDYAKAQAFMWDAARRLKARYDNNICFICEPFNSPDEIHIVGYHRTFLVRHERILYKLKIHRVREMTSM